VKAKPKKAAPKRPAKVAYCDRAIVESPIFYCLVLSEKAYHAECERLGVKRGDWGDWLASDHAHATANHLKDREGKPICIVCLGSREGRMEVQVYGLLIHEAVHIFQRICSYIGERAPSAEFEAYSIQRIAQELIHSYHQQTGKTP
jgi:hypothetical protein